MQTLTRSLIGSRNRRLDIKRRDLCLSFFMCTRNHTWDRSAIVMSYSDKPDTNADTLPRLDLVIDNSLIPRFFTLLQQGVMLRTRVGCSILVFLREEIGAGQGTIDKIQSIFLDGSPVDDLNAATIKDGSVLALSAAMPGLVGATLRRGGLLSSFRNTITYHEDSAHCASGEGFIQIKL